MTQSHPSKLQGKVALITGGTSGIGFATAQAFIQQGAFVYITGRRQAQLDEAVRKLGTQAQGIQGDVASLPDLDRLFSTVQQGRGRLDIVVANAGSARFGPLGTVSEEDFDGMFDSNAKGTFFTVQKSLPLLTDGASVIILSSVVGSMGLPANSVYAATKAVGRSFARTFTTDLKSRRIRVNAISPGPIDTEGLRELLGASADGDQRREGYAASVPLGRVGKPEEIAAAAVYLASDDSSFVTGTELFVDGGFAQV